MDSEVSRNEFNAVRDTVSQMQGAVSKLIEVSQSQERAITKIDNSVAMIVDQINSLSKMQAASHGARGTIQVATVWHSLGFVVTFAVVLGGLMMFVIRSEMNTTATNQRHNTERLKSLSTDIAAHVKDGHPDRVVAMVNRLADQIDRHEASDGHPELAGRVSALEQMVQANHLENETQHRWLSDIFRLNADWQYRTKGLDVTPPNHQPLEGFGQQKGLK